MNTMTTASSYPSARQRSGFVVAMRARMTCPAELDRFEWVIAARWGCAGEHLSLAWTGIASRTSQAPSCLMPRRTALALLPNPARTGGPETFRLTGVLPDLVTVAGDFVPSEGFVQVHGRDKDLRILSEGHSSTDGAESAWHIEAERAAWIGEFIEDA